MRREILLLLLVLSSPAWGGESSLGTRGPAFLLIRPGPRAGALGGAVTSVAEDAMAVRGNPAGLAFLESDHLIFERSSTFGDGTYDNIAYAHPTSNRSTWGLSVTRYALDDIPRTEVTTAGEPITGLGFFGEEDYLVTAAYSRLDRPDFSYGLSIGYISQEIDGTTGEGFTASAGLRYNSVLAGANIGLVVENIGSEITLDRESFQIPLTVRGGISMGRLLGRSNYLIVSSDIVWRDDDEPFPAVGLEFWWANILALRAGFNGEEIDEEGGWSFGLGVRQGDWVVDAAYLPEGLLGARYRVGLSRYFGEPRVRPTIESEYSRPRSGPGPVDSGDAGG